MYQTDVHRMPSACFGHSATPAAAPRDRACTTALSGLLLRGADQGTTLQQETAVQLQQASLQTALARPQRAQRLPAHRNTTGWHYLASFCLVAALVWWI